MAIEFTQEQAVFLVLLIGFISPIFQVLKRAAAFPIVARVLSWIYARLAWVPGNSDTWQRISLYALATAVAWLFNKIILPPFPASPIEFSMPYMTEVLAWGTSVSFLISGFIGLVHLLFHYFWKNLFKAAAAADVPVLKELAPAAIKEAKAANS